MADSRSSRSSPERAGVVRPRVSLALTLSGGALLGGLLAWIVPRPAAATCLNPREIYYHLDEELVRPVEVIYVYINAPDDEDDPACPEDVRRSGLSITDVEIIVKSAVASINDSSAVAPRLVYNGRVCHETNFSCLDDDLASYSEDFEAMTGRPPGVTIQVRPCGTNVGGIAGVKNCERSAHGERGAELISISPFRGDSGTLCPRGDSFSEDNPDCSIDSPNDPTGMACGDPDAEMSCTCTDLVQVNQQYLGKHFCQMGANGLEWSSCMCRKRGYEAYNRGDGQAHPDEPDRCDALGPRDTKELQGVITHELGHILGLGHTQKSGDQCPGPASPPPMSGDAYQGVMRSTAWPSQTCNGHLYHVDDLRGLDWLYSVDAPDQDGPYAGDPAFNRTWRVQYFESEDEGQTWGASVEFELPGGVTSQTMQRVSVSSATDGTGFQAVAFTTGAGELLVATRDDDGFHALSEDELRVPGAVTRSPAAVAYGGERLAVAWLHRDGLRSDCQ